MGVFLGKNFQFYPKTSPADQLLYLLFQSKPKSSKTYAKKPMSSEWKGYKIYKILTYLIIV